LRRDLVAVRLRLYPFLAGDALDLLPVLVEPGQEENVLLRIQALRFRARAVVARQRVVDDGGIESPEVRDRVDVVDRRRDVEAGHRGWRILIPWCSLCIRRRQQARAPVEKPG